jgi:hypothetical protein
MTPETTEDLLELQRNGIKKMTTNYTAEEACLLQRDYIMHSS